MKKYCTLLLFLIATLPTMAQQIFVEKSGNTESIEFSKLDKITFSGTTVKILQTDGTTKEATMGEINRIYFSNYNGIDSPKDVNESIINYISEDCIAVNVNAGEIITVYDITGAQIICIRQKADNGTISIAGLPRGVYIIRTDDRTAKFVKR